MQYSLSLLLALTSVFLEVKGFADDNIFYTDDLDDPNLLSDSSPDLFALNDPTGEFNQYEDVPFDSLLPLPEGAEMEPDSVVAGCLAPDRLGARDDATLCPTNDFKSPELPTLDGFTDKFHPPNEQDNVLKEISPLRYLAPPGEDKKCPADRPYQLCCICDGNFEFAFCQDCRQSKPFLHLSEHLCCEKPLRKGTGI